MTYREEGEGRERVTYREEGGGRESVTYREEGLGGREGVEMLTLYPLVTLLIFHKPIRIYMGSLILGINTLYLLFCF